MKLAVYFNSGNKAVFDESEVRFRTNNDVPITSNATPDVTFTDYYGDTALINWENVCFVRIVEEKADDDE